MTATIMLEERPAEILAEVVDFCLEVGLPVTREDLGLDDVSREDPQRVAEAACTEGETTHNMPSRSTLRWSWTPCSPPTPMAPSAGPSWPAKRRYRK